MEEEYNLVKEIESPVMLMISGDIRYGDVLIRMVGNREMEVENFKGIINYDEKRLILQGKCQLIIISGECLMILSYMENMIRVQGIILDIEFRM